MPCYNILMCNVALEQYCTYLYSKNSFYVCLFVIVYVNFHRSSNTINEKNSQLQLILTLSRPLSTTIVIKVKESARYLATSELPDNCIHFCIVCTVQISHNLNTYNMYTQAAYEQNMHNL